jgi:hypothetical protein
MTQKFFYQKSKTLLNACLAGLAIFCGQLQAGIEVEKVNSEEATVAVKVSNLETHHIFQRSYDLLNWQDLIVTGPELNNVSLPDPTSNVERSIFYRLKTIDAQSEGKMHVNLDPTDAHLFTYRRDPDIELHLFGTRNASGLPSSITDFSCRIGNTSYAGTTQPTEVNPTKDASQYQSKSNLVQASYVTGDVKVKIDPDCPASKSPS